MSNENDSRLLNYTLDPGLWQTQKCDVYLKNISSDRPGCRLTGIAVKKEALIIGA